MKTTQLGLIDDDLILSHKTKDFLNAQVDLTVALYCPDLPSFFMNYDLYNPLDVLLLDISLGENIDSFQHISKIRNLLGPQTKILIYSGHTEEKYIEEALNNTVSGYFLKGSNLEELIVAIRHVYNDNKYLSPLLGTQIYRIMDTVKGEKEEKAKLRIRTSTLEKMGLNKREIQVAIRIIEGYSYDEIAQEIFLSINTIRHYIKSLYSKLGVKNKINLSNLLRPMLENGEKDLYLKQR
jgi:DNA-binding NarL/FixJ family response regulator